MVALQVTFVFMFQQAVIALSHSLNDVMKFTLRILTRLPFDGFKFDLVHSGSVYFLQLHSPAGITTL